MVCIMESRVQVKKDTDEDSQVEMVLPREMDVVIPVLSELWIYH